MEKSLEQLANEFIQATGEYFAAIEVHNGAVEDVMEEGGYDLGFVQDRFASLEEMFPAILEVIKAKVAE